MKKLFLTVCLFATMTILLFALRSRNRTGILGDEILEAYEAASNGVASAEASEAVVSMVFVNSGDAQQTALAAGALVKLLEDETSYQIRAIVPACLGAAVDLMATGQADFGWLPANTYVFAHEMAGAEATLVAVRFGQTNYRGQFLVRNDSGINSLADLAGKNFAFPNDQSTSGFLYPSLHIFKTQGVEYDVFFDEYVFTGSHPGAVDAVYYGNHGGTAIHGGAMFEDARASSGIEDIFAATKVIAYTDYVPNDTVAVRAGLPTAVTQDIVDGIQAIVSRPEWSEIMAQLYGWQDAVPTDDSAYDPVRDAVQYFGLELDKCARVTQITPDDGGVVAHAGGDGLTTTIMVPSGAVTDTVQLAYTPIEAITHIPPGYIEIDHAFDLTGVISGTTQTLTSLTAAYTMSVPYLPSQLQGTLEDELAIYSWDGLNWVKEPTSQVDVTDNKVIATPDHFSTFAVMSSNRNYLPLAVKP